MARPGTCGVRIMSIVWPRCGSAAPWRCGAERRHRPPRAWRIEPLEGRVVPATITVLNTNDSGPDSLRAAIAQADMDTAQDTIQFAPAVTGTITLLSALPDLSTNILLNGPGAS